MERKSRAPRIPTVIAGCQLVALQFDYSAALGIEDRATVILKDPVDNPQHPFIVARWSVGVMEYDCGIRGYSYTQAVAEFNRRVQSGAADWS